MDTLGIIMMGDALSHLMKNKSHRRRWKARESPESSKYNEALEYMAAHPLANTLISIGELTLGLMLVTRARKMTEKALSESS